MLTADRIRQIARNAGFGGINDGDVELCQVVEAEARKQALEDAMSDAFDPVAAAAALRDKIVDEAPRLYARVRELEAELATLRDEVAHGWRDRCRVSDERDALRADNERLRAVLLRLASELRHSDVRLAESIDAALAARRGRE